MVRLPLLLSLATASLASGFSSPAIAASIRDGIGPAVISVDGGIVSPGSFVHFNVQLSGPATGSELLSVLDLSGDFIMIPLTITPSAGATSVGFYALVNPFATGNATIVISDADGKAGWSGPIDVSIG